MKTPLLILLIFFITHNSYSQEDVLFKYLENNDWQKISSYTENRIDSGDKSYKNFHWQYVSYLKTNKTNKAIKSLKEALKYHKDKPSIKSNLADLFFTENRYQESKNILDTLLANNQYRFRDIKQRTLIYEFYRNTPSVLNLLHKHYREDSLNTFYSIHLGDNYRLLKQDSLATYYYENALKISPRNLMVKLKLVNIYLNKKPLRAFQLCDSVIKKDSLNLRFTQKAAIAYIRLDSNKNALALYKKCIIMGDSSLTTIKNTGVLMQKTGNNEKASELLEKAFKIDSTNVNVSYYLAMALSKISELNKSMKYFEKTLSLFKMDPSIKANIYYEQSLIHKKRGDNRKSYIMLSKADKCLNKDTRILYSIAEIYLKISNNPDQKINKFEDFLNVANKKGNKSKSLNKQIKYANYKIKKIREQAFMDSKN